MQKSNALTVQLWLMCTQRSIPVGVFLSVVYKKIPKNDLSVLGPPVTAIY